MRLVEYILCGGPFVKLRSLSYLVALRTVRELSNYGEEAANRSGYSGRGNSVY